MLAYVSARPVGGTPGHFPDAGFRIVRPVAQDSVSPERTDSRRFRFLEQFRATCRGVAPNRLVRHGYQVLISSKEITTSSAVLVASGALLDEATSTRGIFPVRFVSTFRVRRGAGNPHTPLNDVVPSGVVATVHGLASSAVSISGMIVNTVVGKWSAAGSYGAGFARWAILEPVRRIGMWLWFSEPAGRSSDPMGQQPAEVNHAS